MFVFIQVRILYVQKVEGSWRGLILSQGSILEPNLRANCRLTHVIVAFFKSYSIMLQLPRVVATWNDTYDGSGELDISDLLFSTPHECMSNGNNIYDCVDWFRKLDISDLLFRRSRSIWQQPP